ncbi:M15 family metallopeptidase [Brevibacillus fulvus]|uniref:D-alanyl-D-alanine carboxypeptidase n=1 Tax=Brevibacillus fulvus TaxID=1125967 RepID=A0A938XS97_9BACL|nr:M15 family metallopeptidase [Brevibacillus fulvus]MBM7589433.1 D-alanyl-D-alanine carboxypeptidase [Brevibacillus fulvus]
MQPTKKWLQNIVFSMLVAMLASGCQLFGKQQGNGESSPPPATPTVPSDQAEHPPTADPVLFPDIPREITLPPGGKLDLPQVNGLTYASTNPDLLAIGQDGLAISADAKTGQQAILRMKLAGETKETVVKIKASLGDTIKTVNGIPTVTNPEDLSVVVNKQRSLPPGYVPQDLVAPNVPFSFQEKSEKRLMRREAASALEKMFAAAKEEGVTLLGVSAYRSEATQKGLFAYYVETQGLEHAERFSAHPGKSEHQTGLAIDVSGRDAATRLEQTFAETIEGKWLAAHAHQFGFIIRYPKGKEEMTGYAYEPWHIRYVGVNMAKEIAEQGITLEQYFADSLPVSGK